MKRKAKVEPVLTPYAVLLVRYMDTDDEIRREYHAFARKQHPDLRKDKQPGPLWQKVNEAYALIETVKLRNSWHRAMNLNTGVCERCAGCGTTGSRVSKLSKVKLCVDCKGFGRV